MKYNYILFCLCISTSLVANAAQQKDEIEELKNLIQQSTTIPEMESLNQKYNQLIHSNQELFNMIHIKLEEVKVDCVLANARKQKEQFPDEVVMQAGFFMVLEKMTRSDLEKYHTCIWPHVKRDAFQRAYSYMNSSIQRKLDTLQEREA